MTCDPCVFTKREVLKISQKFGSCTCAGMNIRKVAGSEMFDFLPAVFLVMLGRALYRRRSLFDPRLVVVLVKVFATIC